VTKKAVIASLKSDLDSNADKLELYYTEHNGVYPSALDANNCPSAPVVDTTTCLKASTGNELNYSGGGQSFTLIDTHISSGLAYQINESGDIVDTQDLPAKSLVYSFGLADSSDIARSVVRTSDGGYAIAGTVGNDAIISKISSSGNVSWSKKWGGVDTNDLAYSITQTSDGGYAIAGQTESYGAGDWDAFIAKFTSDGTLSWSKTWGGTNTDSAQSITQTSDGGYIISGTTYSYTAGNNDAFIAKFTSGGALSWSKTWGGTGADGAFSVVQTSDGGCAISGETDSYGSGDYASFIAKFTSDGTLSWSKTWGGTKADRARSIVQTSDGGYAVSGWTNSYGAGTYDAFILKYASDGTLSWSKTWGGTGFEFASSIIQSSDGGYAIAGETDSYGAGSYDAFIAKFAFDGTLSWSKTWGGTEYDTAQSITQTSDSGYVLAGYTNSYGSVYEDVFIAKYNSSVTIQNCSSPMCQSVSASISSPSNLISSPSATVLSPSATSSSPSAINSAVNLIRIAIVSASR
jgi:uncharacterized delta-60 repeat protein